MISLQVLWRIAAVTGVLAIGSSEASKLPNASVAEQAVTAALASPVDRQVVAATSAAPAASAKLVVKAAAPAAPTLVKAAAKPVQATPAVVKVAAKPAVKPVVKLASKPVVKPTTAAQTRQQGVARAQQQSRAARPVRSAVVRATAYNSTPGQTDSTPFITATGTRTRFGVVALSRDMLRQFPYGTRIKIEDLSGRYNSMFAGRVFIVEDTMHPRKVGRVDIWMSSYSQAIQFGTRMLRITAVN